MLSEYLGPVYMEKDCPEDSRIWNEIWRMLISINWISSTKEMNTITRKSMSKLVTSLRAVGQTHTEWEIIEKLENTRQMYGRVHGPVDICLLFSGFSNVYHFACVWPTALKLGCLTNFDMLFLISLVDGIQFMLSSIRHICIRSIFVLKITDRAS